jgi:hypothetical protein
VRIRLMVSTMTYWMRGGANEEGAGGAKQFWTLDDWPEGYRFFVHNTLKSTGGPRYDTYLYGESLSSFLGDPGTDCSYCRFIGHR